MDRYEDATFEDLAKGCLFGALCGDSLGSFLEFRERVNRNEVSEALKMPGGGPFHLASGQITDDGELTLCLGHGLVEGKGVLDLDKIAKYYGKWVESNPFDIGVTTRLAMGQAFGQTTHLAKRLREGAQGSVNSQSNGALMRITPLCIWVSNLERDELIRCVIQETRLTHPNKTAIDMSVVYVYTVQHLLRNKGDNKGAYAKCKEIVEYLGNNEIKKWIEDVDKNKLPPANEKIGWGKIALCYALYFLKNSKSYEDAMKEMLTNAGDTDTNCCIVGGMLGALHGFKNLPQKYYDAVMNFKPEDAKKSQDNLINSNRPRFLVPYYSANCILKEIIANRPTRKAVILGDKD